MPLLKEPIRQCFEKSSELLPIDGLQKSRLRDQSVAPALFDIPGFGLRRGPKDDLQSFLQTRGCRHGIIENGVFPFRPLEDQVGFQTRKFLPPKPYVQGKIRIAPFRQSEKTRP